MFPINREIGIQCQHRMIFMNFGHADNASIGQRHWRIPIFPRQPVQRAGMLLQSKRNGERTILEKAKQRILGLRKTREQIDRFGKHRLADKKRRVQRLDTRGSPKMMSFRSIEKRDERSSISDGLHRARSP